VDLYPLIAPALRALDPERAHRLTLWALRHGLAPKSAAPYDPRLAQTLWGRTFPNPIGLAAGFDKDAAAVGPLLDLGFGFVEVGSITPRPQPGNPRPRVFRLPEDGAVINRMGFNSAGLDVAEANLAAFRRSGRGGVVGVNLGKNRDSEDAAADYALGARRLAPLADYLVVNVSSPNTPRLRALQSRDALARLLDRVLDARESAGVRPAPPLLLKIAPDLTQQDKVDIAEVALASGLDGLIVSNTTIARPPGLQSRHRREAGGLSGRPLFDPSTVLLGEMSRLTGGRLVLIGVGGVDGVQSALEKIENGASLVEVYTALVYRGPRLVARITAELADKLATRGASGIAGLVGRQVS